MPPAEAVILQKSLIYQGFPFYSFHIKKCRKLKVQIKIELKIVKTEVQN